MSFSELKSLESEVLRLEKAHSKAADQAARSGIAAKILEHCKRIGDLEKRAFISYKVRVEELIPRYQESAGVSSAATPSQPSAPPLPSGPVRATTQVPLPTAPIAPPPVALPPASAAPAPIAPPPPPPPPATVPAVVVPPAPKTAITPILAPIDVSVLAAKVEALGRQPFSPDAYPSRKLQYERLIQEISTARDTASSEAPFLTVLARLWEYSIREDDAFEDYRKLNRA
ncbi:MAG: hypothetical protein JSR82_11410 [Verrucomicrobia bacterium]|nr:hypothetical protein [Verrucomicrobiota bacterium]